MPADDAKGKTGRFDPDMMAKRERLPEAGEDAPRPSQARAGAGRKGDWIASQLRKVYDEALNEAIPPEMLDLLKRIDEPGGDRTDKPTPERGGEDEA